MERAHASVNHISLFVNRLHTTLALVIYPLRIKYYASHKAELWNWLSYKLGKWWSLSLLETGDFYIPYSKGCWLTFHVFFRSMLALRY